MERYKFFYTALYFNVICTGMQLVVRLASVKVICFFRSCNLINELDNWCTCNYYYQLGIYFHWHPAQTQQREGASINQEDVIGQASLIYIIDNSLRPLLLQLSVRLRQLVTMVTRRRRVRDVRRLKVSVPSGHIWV